MADRMRAEIESALEIDAREEQMLPLLSPIGCTMPDACWSLHMSHVELST